MNNSEINYIESFIDNEEWKNAREKIQKLLRKTPNDHWLLTRLSSTYYEEGHYLKALEVSKKALGLEPKCPLVLWDYAGASDMANHNAEAISIWKSLLNLGVKRVAFCECGEGIRWAKSLLNDCRYRLSLSYLKKNKRDLALKYIIEHLDHRKPGLPSLYSLKEAKKIYHSLTSSDA